MQRIRSCFQIGMALSLGLAAFALSACEDESREGGDGTPATAFDLCCDCTCTDGLTPCQHFIIDSDGESNCETVCADACATNEDCSGVDSADVCTGTPPPAGLNDLLCNSACSRVYDECGLTLTGEDGLPIPDDQCDRYCETEVVPIPALNCLSQIPCQELYILECLEQQPYDVLSDD